MIKAVLIVFGIAFFTAQAGAAAYHSYKESVAKHQSAVQATFQKSEGGM